MNTEIVKTELMKSTSDAVITGICGGIAQKFSIEAWMVRVGFVITAFAGIGLYFYFILAISLSKDSDFSSAYENKVLGVCKRLAIKYNWHVSTVRIIFSACLVLSLVPSVGTTLLIYFAIHFFLPEQKHTQNNVVDVITKNINS